jgi:hypothetical protein
LTSATAKVKICATETSVPLHLVYGKVCGLGQAFLGILVQGLEAASILTSLLVAQKCNIYSAVYTENHLTDDHQTVHFFCARQGLSIAKVLGFK